MRYGLRAANIEEVIRKIKTSLARLYTQFLTSTYPSLLIKMSSFLLLSKELFTWKFYDLFQGRMMWVFESDLPVFFFFFSKFLQLNMTRYYVLDPINILIFFPLFILVLLVLERISAFPCMTLNLLNMRSHISKEKFCFYF